MTLWREPRNHAFGGLTVTLAFQHLSSRPGCYLTVQQFDCLLGRLEKGASISCEGEAGLYPSLPGDSNGHSGVVGGAQPGLVDGKLVLLILHGETVETLICHFPFPASALGLSSGMGRHCGN